MYKPAMRPIHTNFNPRSPCGERPRAAQAMKLIQGFQSTLPVWGATAVSFQLRFYQNISIHAPRVGSDALCDRNGNGAHIFQSTLPVWGATLKEGTLANDLEISIHAPRVGSDYRPPEWWAQKLISIHAPRVGSDS